MEKEKKNFFIDTILDLYSQENVNPIVETPEFIKFSLFAINNLNNPSEAIKQYINIRMNKKDKIVLKIKKILYEISKYKTVLSSFTKNIDISYIEKQDLNLLSIQELMTILSSVSELSTVVHLYIEDNVNNVSVIKKENSFNLSLNSTFEFSPKRNDFSSKNVSPKRNRLINKLSTTNKLNTTKNEIIPYGKTNLGDSDSEKE